MAVRHGYGKIAGTDALVFAYDTGDTRNSYRGEPTTNVHPYPLDIYAQTTSATRATLSRDTSITSPVGGIPLKMVVDSSDPYINTYSNSSWNLAAAASGQTWTASAYVKGNRAMTAQIFIFEADSSGNYLNFTTEVINIGTEWTRISATRTFNNGSTAYVQARLDGPDTYNAGDILWWDGYQVEQKSHATTFTTGTRSSTQGLLDLTGNKTLSLASTSFTGNGNITFDGTNDTIVVPSINLQQDFTLEAVIRMYERSSFGIFGQGGFSANQGLHILYNHGSRGMIFGMYANDNDYGANWIGELNTYYHVVFTYNHETHNKEFYANGVLQNPASSTENAYAGTGDMRIGMTYSPSVGVVSPAYGDIPISKLYNKVLTADEVRNNYRHYKTRFDI